MSTRRPAPPPARVLMEAWWGGNRAAGARPEPPHVVEWVPGMSSGRALCGRELPDARTYRLGIAAATRVTRCPECERRLEQRRPSAPVVQISAIRRASRAGGGWRG